ncbi:adenosylcobinamide-GDP ribazoletransferase [Psychromonas antarctica]|uniref:adenosylcobinamide-GDP ribazoletransferase n=1 Tax=Psychromonas antarctica TaxID=67573 RepID=UPI001EE98B87|nr:adenosylcobinamide-GDP ribazoletransferase [Psychromonas antarctica]MCG6202479.1 adenosylcobinamide-GDP ribazoletransferase [Psychromonas antarctica]
MKKMHNVLATIKRESAKELNLFFLALSFFTRIPVPKSMHYSPSKLNQANRYFSLVGLLLAVLQGGIFIIFIQILPLSIALLLALAAGLILTGAFHEDGLADMADGIGGGLTTEQRLSIMKDSRVGTYGVVTLTSIMALKYLLLFELAQQEAANPLSFVITLSLGFALSRALAASLIFNTPYVSELSGSKSKPLASAQSRQELLILFLVALLPALFFSFYQVMTILLLLALFRVLLRTWLIEKIGGFTGDCLGATQQISEVIIYIVLLASYTITLY